MPSAAVLGPVVIPLLAAAVIAAVGLARFDLGRTVGAGGAWGCVAALLAVWLPVRSSVELILGQLGYGSALDLRIDGVTFAFGLMIAVPIAVLLTLQPRAWPQTALSLLALAAALAAVEAGGVVLTAMAGGTVATLAVVMLETEDPRAPRPSWALLLAGWLGVAWVGVILQVVGGTAVYTAVPVAAITGPVFAVLAASAVIASCLFPWRTWLAVLWRRPSLRAAAVTIATVYPLGFYLLIRAYELGGGRYPHPLFNVGLAVLGSAAAWATWMVAGARAIGLPGGRGRPASETFAGVAMLIATLTLVAGPALAVIQFGMANPVAAEVMQATAGTLTGGRVAVVTVSSVLPVVTLFVPLLLIGVVIYALTDISAIRTQARPAIFRIPAAASLERFRAAVRAASVPDQYRTILNLKQLEAAAAGGRPVFWLAALVALGFAVTR